MKLFDYIVIEYRRDHAAQDIQEACGKCSSHRLAWVLENERLLIFERAFE